MKKTILTVCLIAMAVSVRALPINWSATGIKGSAGETLTSVNQMYVELYLLATPLSLGAGQVWESTYGTGGSLIKGGLISTTSRVNTDIPEALGTAAWAESSVASYIAGQSAGNKDNATFYMKFYFNAGGGMSGPSGYTYSGVSHNNTIFIANYLGAQITAPFASVSTQGIQWTPASVPEPTTMALFGLGGLALMIRRKMRKEA